MNGQKPQAWGVSGLAHLNSLDTSNLYGCLESFLLAKDTDNRAAKTLLDYRQKLTPFIEFCKNLGVSAPEDVMVEHIRLYLKERKERNSPITTKDHFGVIKVFFNWMRWEHILQKSPMEGMHPPKVPEKIPQPFNEQQIGAMLRLFDPNTFLGARNTAIVFTFLDSGVRLAEMTGMAIPNLDLHNGVIKVLGKGSKERLVGISRTTRKAILRYLIIRNQLIAKKKRANSSMLWLSEELRPMQLRGIQIVVIRAGRAAGIQGVRCSPHTFRHTFAQVMFDNGCNLFNLQHLLGHTDIKTTQVYLKGLGQKAVMRAYEKGGPVDNLKLR